MISYRLPYGGLSVYNRGTTVVYKEVRTIVVEMGNKRTDSPFVSVMVIFEGGITNHTQSK